MVSRTGTASIGAKSKRTSRHYASSFLVLCTRSFIAIGHLPTSSKQARAQSGNAILTVANGLDEANSETDRGYSK